MHGFTKKPFIMPVRICIQQIILVYFAELRFATLKGSRVFRRQLNMPQGLWTLHI